MQCIFEYGNINVAKSQKIWNKISFLILLWLRNVLEDLEFAVQILVEGEHRSDIAYIIPPAISAQHIKIGKKVLQLTASIAVVGRGPHGDEVPLGEVVLVALHHQLMRSAHQLDLIVVDKLQQRQEQEQEQWQWQGRRQHQEQRND